MKPVTALAICLFAAGTISAQQTTQKSSAPKSKSKKEENAVEGTIKDAHRHPIADVQAFIYAKDSSIIASGYTDATGHFETNAVMPGSYTVKVVYPDAKIIMVTGVVIKKGYTPLNISAEPPTADTTLPYTSFMPLPDKTKNAKKK